MITHLLHGRDVLGGNVSSHNDTLELKIFTRLWILLHRLDVSNYASILSRTSGLLLVCIVELCALRDGLAIGNARFASCTFNVVLTSHTLNIDFKVKLSHARDDCL